MSTIAPIPILFLILCFTSYFVFSIAVLPHSPGVAYYHLLLRREIRIAGVAPFSFQNRDMGSFFVHRGQNFIHPQPLGGCLVITHDPGMRRGLESNKGPLD